MSKGETMIEIESYSQQSNEFGDQDLVCYCFEYTRKDIEKDFVANNSRSTIFENIASEKKMGKCDCAQKNPKGR
jgi:hypothetical protein